MECLICKDSLRPHKLISNNRCACKYEVHARCWTKYTQYQVHNNGEIRCPMCRSLVSEQPQQPQQSHQQPQQQLQQQPQHEFDPVMFETTVQQLQNMLNEVLLNVEERLRQEQQPQERQQPQQLQQTQELQQNQQNQKNKKVVHMVCLVSFLVVVGFIISRLLNI